MTSAPDEESASQTTQRSTKWDASVCYHHYLRKDFVGDLLVENGDFLVRKSEEHGWVVSTKYNGVIQHCQPIYNGTAYSFGSEKFKRFADLVGYHFSEGVPIGKIVDQKVLLLNPIEYKKCIYKPDDVAVGEKLGEGKFSEVFEAKILSLNKTVAMKALRENMDQTTRDNFYSEMAMMNSMRHENIVECVGVVEDHSQVKILLELINRGSLDRFMAKTHLNDRGRLRVAVQVARGMVYLHAHNIIHRDLAARNILIHLNEDKTVKAKVSDFGLSRSDPNGHGYSLKRDQQLPARWMAPEYFLERCWTMASDVWAFGVLLWELWTNGDHPYADIPFCNDGDYLAKFIAKGGHPTEVPRMDSNVRKIMLRCWDPNPSNRPTMENVLRALEHVLSSVKQQDHSKPKHSRK